MRKYEAGMIRNFFNQLKSGCLLVALNRFDKRLVRIYITDNHAVRGVRQINSELEIMKSGVSLREYVEKNMRNNQEYNFNKGIPLLEGEEKMYQIEDKIEKYLEDIGYKVGVAKIRFFVL